MNLRLEKGMKTHKKRKISSLLPTGFKVIALIFSLAMIMFSSALAQDVAVGQATATVQTPLTVTATAALAFGTVFQGVPKSVAVNSANAGVFTITGQAGTGISVYLQLPDYMSTSSGDDRMVIAFSSTDCSIDTTGIVDPTGAIVGWVGTNPYSLPATVTVSGAGASSAIFLGGSVNPSVDQAAGAYTADIILTVAYNGT